MARVSKGEVHAELYSKCYEQLSSHASKGEFDEAISIALESLPHVPHLLTYLARNSKGETAWRVESIDFLLLYAPLFLHEQSLKALSEFLKSNRAVPKKLSHDVNHDLEIAFRQLGDTHRAWIYLHKRSPISHRQLCEDLGSPFDRWDFATTYWQKLGFLLCIEHGQEKVWMLVGAAAHKVRGKCQSCGATGAGGLYKLLERFVCPKCKSDSGYVIVGL